MKLDKETVIKQRFWFLLPIFAICLLVGWICVLGVRGETEKNYKTAKDKDTQLKNIATTQHLKNEQWNQAIVKELDVSSGKKDELWYRESDRQNKVQRDPQKRENFTRLDPFITWPEETRNQWIKTNPGRDLSTIDFGTYLGNIPSDEYRREYLGQFERIVDTIRDWLDETNSNNILGAVRVLGGSGNHRNYVVRQLLSPHRLSPDNHILSDEIFLLQEDIAIKREIFRSLNDLLDSYSKLKTEWNEVHYVEITEQAAPAATVVPATGVPVTPPAVAAVADVTPVKKESEPEVFQRFRFYNYVWPNLLSKQDVEKDAKLASSLIELGLPAIEANKGWRIDMNVMTDPQDEKKLLLRSTSSNHSNLFTLPVQPLMIWYSELKTEQEVPTPLLLPDAGGVGPSEYWPNGTLKKIGQKKLKDISLPANFGKITRITRIMPENAIDQQIAFNNDWLVSVQLQRRPNSPTLTLKGEMINRSGRRLPVASFTAGLNVANDSKLMHEDFKVPTDAFNAGERRSFTQEIKSPVQPRSINMVKQKLTWRSTPIKRIDHLEIGQTAHTHSDRLKTIPLKPYDFKRKDPQNLNPSSATAAATPQSGEGFGNSGGPPGGMALGSAGGSRGGMGAGSGGGSGSGSVSANHQIPLNRYVQVDNELRRIPVALVMVVDATAITDIIGAMSNSRLRFQVTLAPWTKVPALGRPGASGSTTTAPSGPPAPGSGGSSTPPNMGGGPGKPGMALGSTGGGAAAPSGGRAGAGGSDFVGGGQGSGSTPPGTGAGANRPTQNLGLEDDSSVVELQIYGLITIYESPDLFKMLEKQAVAGTPATPK